MTPPPCARSWFGTLASTGGWLFAQATPHMILSNVVLVLTGLSALATLILTIRTLMKKP